MKQLQLHLISDSTAQTVSTVARSAIANFDGIEPVEHMYPLIRTMQQLERVIDEVKKLPGIVLYTFVDNDLREHLKKECLKLDVPCIPVLSRVVAEIAGYLGEDVSPKAGKQYELTEEYFSKIDALNFVIEHDDGQGAWNLEKADIVLVGVSRTSKTPTCVYLAHRGFKAANVPFVSLETLPKNLTELKKPLTVGLTIGTERLSQIRKTRLQSLNQDVETDYVETGSVRDEIATAYKFYKQNNWPVIDVSRRSIEESAALIMKHYYEHTEKK